ncbi:hypothetical protein FJT64_022605 [Amphibalanus amphitrite]|uniref:Uncharacterized protein n=1 Tax=Amphibalanus amphitrite TaxID=1232801 RepID=A0A6A4WQ06_AMPAM|nr:hypothetical protein FJT64_022605 [Amphibalanus amphitrite]
MACLNRCCCCVPLRSGALTIAILYLVVNVGVLFGWACWFFAEVGMYNAIPVEDDDYRHYRFRNIRFLGFILGVLCLACGINITMDSLLVHGIRRNQRRFMLPWVVWYGIFTSLVTLSLLGTELYLLVEYVDAAKNPYDGIGILIAFLVMIGSVAAISLPVMWYWYACVLSYYVVLAPSDMYVMEALRETTGPEGARLARRPVEDTK